MKKDYSKSLLLVDDRLVKCLDTPKIGYGVATAHHGEIFQGVVKRDGCLHRALVSLPCNIFRSEASFFPDKSGVLSVEPNWKTKASEAAKLTLSQYGMADCGGRLKIDSNIPIGWGLGSSTSDIVATIQAIVDALGKNLSQERIAALAVKAEMASDSTMFAHRTVLFAHREGVILEEFGAAFPDMEVVGFNTDCSGIGVDTLKFVPARYSWQEIEAFRPLLGLLRRAMKYQDPYLIGQVASASAVINQAHLAKPYFQRLMSIAETVPALGVQVAHSGTVVGFLFDAGDKKKQNKIEKANKLIKELGFREIWHFSVLADGV
jgi:uncharacterized protein involved in propanediol utilization